MAIKAEASGTFESVPAGIYNAVLAQVVDLGQVKNKFYNPAEKGSRPTSRQIVYVFQLETRKSDGSRFLKEFWFNLSANPKANIAKFLNGWFGRALTDQELQLDHEGLVGKALQVIVGINQKGNPIITGAVPPNPNSVIQIEPYDTAEYSKNLFERLAKMENTQAAYAGNSMPNYQPPITNNFDPNEPIPF